MSTDTLSEEREVTRAVVRINAVLTGIILGLLLGIGLFIATNWLLIRGGPNVGLHLSLLNQYFPGYSVTFVGSLIGFFWAFLTGFIGGYLVGAIYNRLTA